MMLCIDIGNSQIFGGVFDDDVLRFKFRYASSPLISSDEIGVFLRSVLRENELDYRRIKKISICSVVPSLDYAVRAACIKYFDSEPFFLAAGKKTGLKIKYRNPLEVGSDRIVNAIAAVELFPNRDILVVDFGTATTCCAITKEKEYLGGAIMPGLKLSMKALESNTAKLSSVEIIKPNNSIGRSTKESLQSGLFLMQKAAVREIFDQFELEQELTNKAIRIGTGGFAPLFEQEAIFDVLEPNLVLMGLKHAFNINTSAN